MKFNLSSSPHVRGAESTRSIMYDVCIALLPATIFGVYRFGIYSLLVLLVSIGFAILAEYAYQNITGQKVLISDGSALLTGLLLGLNMPPHAPLWMAALGSIFAIIVVKQFFGGLGHNFMNPALGGRVFLLISFTSLMSDFAVDATSSATPLAVLKESGRADVWANFFGLTTGTIGEISAIALIIGGLYLLWKKIITWEIPVVYMASFVVFIAIFGGHGVDPSFIFAHLFGGGLMLGAWFMATDYVTSPITKNGKILYGIVLGVLTGIFRIFGVAAEGVSYAIILGNILVPLIEKVTMPKAFGLEDVKKEKPAKQAAEEAEQKQAAMEAATKISMKTYSAALNLTVITLIAGLLLGVVFQVTKEPIKKAEMAAQTAAFAAVCPQAESFDEAPEIMEQAPAVEGVYGNVVIDGAYKALDASGNVNGYVVNVITKEGFGGEISASIGFDETGVITGIEFLSISETAGLGMNATEESWRAQFCGVSVDKFSVTKDGGAADDQINAISGATITSNAVTGAVNTALAAVKAVIG